MTISSEEEQFLRDHRLCVVTTLRKDGSPQSTPVYYLYEEGKLLISVTKERKKTHNVLNDPRVSVCAIAEERPFDYVQVMGKASITEDNLVETSRRIWSRFKSELPEDFDHRMLEQKRVVMVVTPELVNSRLTVPEASVQRR